MVGNIKVTIWGKEVGRLTWDASRKRSIFEYAPNFLKGELDIALNGYKPLYFDYIIEGKGITVKNLHWTEMGNGAMRLEAELNGIPFRATFAKKSKEYPAIMENGGIKMYFEKQKEYVERLFLPRVTS